MLAVLRRQWRVSGQRGSVLSALLIIIAFLAILGGALLNEISGQFLLTQTLANRISKQATVNSSVESSISQLQTRVVPSRCSTDPGVPSSVSLNGVSAAASSTCKAIVPDVVTQLTPGSFSANGTHVTGGGRNTYLVGDAGGNLYNYRFGQALMWWVPLGRALTGSPSQAPDPGRAGHFMTVTPVGNGVALVDDFGSGAQARCTMSSNGVVISQPGFENAPARGGAYFPSYAFFGDSSGRLFVYDARTNGSCGQVANISGLGGPVVGGLLVLSGQQATGNNVQCGGSGGGGDGDADDQTSRTAEIFAIVNSGGSGRLVHYEYCEATRNGQVVASDLSPIESKSLSIGTPVGVAFSSTTPSSGASIRLAVTSQAGQVALASIRASNGRNGLSYSISSNVNVASLRGSFTSAPYWCHCPGGDSIGIGNTNGHFYLLDTGLNVRFQFPDPAVVNAPAINTTPAADANGDWYFGADDGNVYDVEPPATGTVMFLAAHFGPGNPVQSSPIVGGTSDGCAGRVCIYFGAGNGSGFAQIGDIRVMDLRACLTSSAGSTTCAGNPRLWTRVEVGNPTFVGGQGVHVIGWSYYNP